MNRFHGIVLVVNTLLPAIIGLVLVAIHLALLRPALEDAGRVRASFDRVDQAAAELRKHYQETSSSFAQRIGTIRQLLDPPRKLYGGVKKLSENFCGNIGRGDLWSKSAGGIQVASLTAARLPGGVDVAFAHQAALGSVTGFVDDTLERLRGRGEQATRFATQGACKTTEVAFAKTFTVLAAVMAPFHEIDIAIGDLQALYVALNLEATFPALMRIGARVGSALTVLGYLALALILWFGIVYASWASARLREGWRLIRQ